jgi:hypothetical protein
MICRSKGANLEVIIDANLQIYRPIEKTTVISTVLPELHRISVMHIACPQLLQSLVDSFVSAAPKLEFLYLSTSHGVNACRIPDTIFS